MGKSMIFCAAIIFSIPMDAMKERQVTVGSSTYEQIKHDIIFGELAPSSKLKLGVLREKYDASVSTLRETLRRLDSEGFVLAEEQRGFFVTSVSRKDLIEVAHLRGLLECNALRQSIANGDREWEGNLVAAHHKLQQSEEIVISGDESEKETWKRYDWEFHLAMIQACDNANLLSLHSTIYEKYLRYQILVLTNRGREAANEHTAMYKATLARDAEVATDLLDTHITNGLTHTLEHFDPDVTSFTNDAHSWNR